MTELNLVDDLNNLTLNPTNLVDDLNNLTLNPTNLVDDLNNLTLNPTNLVDDLNNLTLNPTPTYLQCLPREILDEVFKKNDQSVRSYVVRSSANIFAYVWEIYGDYTHSIYLPMIIAREYIQIIWMTNNDCRDLTYHQMMQDIGTNKNLQIDIWPNSKSTVKEITISINQAERSVAIFTGKHFGCMDRIPKKYYDHFMIWITYVITMWKQDGVVD